MGKSTLLRRMAKQSIPGIPLHFRFGYVQQELAVAEDISVLNFIMKTATPTVASLERSIADLKKRDSELEALMEVRYTLSMPCPHILLACDVNIISNDS